jgi:hypothetical protein
MPEIYFENAKTGKRYKVIKFDQATGEMVLRGEHAEFTEKYDKDRFIEMGYALVKA